MRILQKTNSRINIADIDDHELTGLDVVTAAVLFDTKKEPATGIFHEYAHCSKGRSIHAAGQMEWLTAKLMTDPRLLQVLRELKLLMDMFFHFPLNLVWFTCTPSISLLMMTFAIPHVFFTSPGIWDASVLCHGIPPPLLEKIHQKLMILYSWTLFLMNLEISTMRGTALGCFLRLKP